MNVRRSRGPVYRARLKPLRIGPYFRRYSASASRSGARAGWTSQGFRFGTLTVNTTAGTWTWDSPGPGSVQNAIPAWILRALPAFLTRQPDSTRRSG